MDDSHAPSLHVSSPNIGPMVNELLMALWIALGGGGSLLQHVPDLCPDG